MFADGLGHRCSIPGWIMRKTQKWHLIPPCLTLSTIRYVSRTKLSNLEKGVAPSPSPRCTSYWKWTLRVTLDNGHQLFLRKGRRWLRCTHMGRGMNLQLVPFPFLLRSKSSWSYNIPDAHWNFRGYTPSSLHVDTFPSSVPPSQFPRYFRREHLHLIYIRYQVHFLLFSSNPGLTSASVSTDLKNVFITLSNKILLATIWTRFADSIFFDDNRYNKGHYQVSGYSALRIVEIKK